MPLSPTIREYQVGGIFKTAKPGDGRPMVESQIEARLNESLVEDGDLAANPLTLIDRIVKAAVSAKNYITNSLSSIPQGLEDIIVAKALAWFDAWAEGNNENLPDWIEPTLEAGMRIVLEKTLRAVL